MAVVVIAQARMGSTRLPGKVMMDLNGIPVIRHVLNRLLLMTEADRICVATSELPRDSIIEDEAERLGVLTVRGSEDDVLCRYAKAAEVCGAKTVVRVTCDCPLISPELCDSLVKKYRSSKFDYAVISAEYGWPKGLDCEVFSASLLHKANKHAFVPSDREHVTPWIIRNAKKSTSIMPKAKVNQRWVLDSEEDYIFLKKLFENSTINLNDWRSVLAFLIAEQNKVVKDFGQSPES